ncbi:hypothetical protein [Pedobacter mendelii]|uniref:TerB family tellurite resistance protein n=2 Tax=Pedobacter mendelii TaxID=1908240 RepID=A0ABQ2BDE6_9SPHI|nr:hypothetical protein [Pedobacter mendelii]GGI23339.1 hypothetical protein GCM10008119_07150 [Pedobacter mendelii]
MLFLSVTATFGQTFSEWFNQKKTQKKYLIEQIVALQVYAGYLKKGYEIAGQGINTVKDIKDGEFGLHNVFIGSLKKVNPAIRKSGKVIEIIAYQVEISKALSRLKAHEWLSADHYVRNVKDKVMEECRNDLEELLLVITSGKVEMTDDERINRLDKLHSAMQDKAAFVQSFQNQTDLLIRQQEHSQRSINQIKKYYGIID